MTTQEENELLCEKLLGWKRTADGPAHDMIWLRPAMLGTKPIHLFERTPPFQHSGDGMLMLLEALQKADQRPDLSSYEGSEWFCMVDATDGIEMPAMANSAPAAVRAAALAYIRSQS